MNYYKINFTLSTKIRGNDNYIKDYKLKIPPTGQLYWEVPKFVGNIYHEKINFEPYLLDIELFANSKVNDLIMDGGPISGKLIMSGTLKRILEKSRNTGMQFFNISILKKNEAYHDYWLINMYEFNQEFIDFKNCKIIYEKKDENFNVTYSTKNIEIHVDDLEEFENHLKRTKEKLEITIIEKLALKEDIIGDDFFSLRYVSGGVGYYVSEKLKNKIEDTGCTGIEFQPSELSYNEWVAPGGEREKVYGKL
ncbi:hypothetical protein CQ046_03175 [Chryseobacterium sp. MYb7]|uniref:imm11 family protein n=1 Tax=Chryseobacterium sp. MYb7 TaxID=1827290 RepID=UPI000CFFECC0|nr:DUF1629 domain-containing protein [Chryseobacterium sp. MYb7]PRB06184.1 hypothetical protein CQ046_03175 [Chryseobacterium sp. MYb7]